MARRIITPDRKRELLSARKQAEDSPFRKPDDPDIEVIVGAEEFVIDSLPEPMRSVIVAEPANETPFQRFRDRVRDTMLGVTEVRANSGYEEAEPWDEDDLEPQWADMSHADLVTAAQERNIEIRPSPGAEPHALEHCGRVVLIFHLQRHEDDERDYEESLDPDELLDADEETYTREELQAMGIKDLEHVIWTFGDHTSHRGMSQDQLIQRALHIQQQREQDG